MRCSRTPGMSDISSREGTVNENGSKIEPRHTSEHASRRPRKKKGANNPLQVGLLRFLENKVPVSFFETHPQISLEELASTLPKRYTVYKPLLLLPNNVFSATPQWEQLYAALDRAQKQELYESLVTAFSVSGVTHVAKNSPIAPTEPGGSENVVRSPTGLEPLYGDFGSISTSSAGATLHPSQEELDSALWVETVQNGGVHQVWAPLYTMFSRGNIVEKARILGLSSTFDGLEACNPETAVVDMYAGIGYFVFSYLKRGVKRVWAWEINGWSIEGLRRGCALNGWDTKTLVLDNNGEPTTSLTDFINNLTDSDRAVIFHGSNEFAPKVVKQVQSEMERSSSWTPIRHINLGLLPTSKASWSGAVQLLDTRTDGWVHVHENVDINDINSMGQSIVQEYARLIDLHRAPAPDCKPRCCHVEQVKTYAPSVMHCVYDIHVPSSQV